jgi:hypothetical protein
MSDCSASMFTTAVTNRRIWNPALIKSRSFTRESMTHENTRGKDSTLGEAESLGLGAPPAVLSLCVCGLGGAVFFLRDLEEVGPEAALADFFMSDESGAFA